MIQEQIKERLEELTKELSKYEEECKNSEAVAKSSSDFPLSLYERNKISILSYCRTRILDILKDL